jgi:hypothetical protein
MATLYARLQEIIGEKIFRHKVTFDGDVVFKKHITAYAPVTGEPSLGTPHKHYATIINADPAVTTVISVDISAHVPVGTTWIEGCWYITSTTVGDWARMLNAAGTEFYDYVYYTSDGAIAFHFSCPVVNRTIYYAVFNARVSNVTAIMTRYWS